MNDAADPQRTRKFAASGPRRAETSMSFRVPGEVDRLLVTESGFYFGLGWASDDGLGPAHWSLEADLGLPAVTGAALRASRPEVAAGGSKGADQGFRVLGKGDAGSLIRSALRVRARYGAAGSDLARVDAARFDVEIAPEVVSEKRLLDTFLEAIAADAGGLAELSDFLAGPGGADLMALVARHVASCLSNPYTQTFGNRPVPRAFVTTLGDSADPIATQPLLFRRRQIEFGQWIYVCASRDVGARALETARWVADLYDAMITIIVLADDGGVGPGCDIGVACAQSDSICLVGRDVFPSPAHGDGAGVALSERAFGADLWGALLFVDDSTLANAGLRFEREVHLRRRQTEPGAGPVVWPRAAPIGAGTAFHAQETSEPTSVAAISSAFMAFDKSAFERVGGFSSRYVYEGSEASDLSLRWRQAGGRVLIDPKLRFLHLEGFGFHSPARRGAAIVNRCLFALRGPELGAGSAA